jgi:hypothetical protein
VDLHRELADIRANINYSVDPERRDPDEFSRGRLHGLKSDQIQPEGIQRFFDSSLNNIWYAVPHISKAPLRSRAQRSRGVTILRTTEGNHRPAAEGRTAPERLLPHFHPDPRAIECRQGAV